MAKKVVVAIPVAKKAVPSKAKRLVVDKIGDDAPAKMLPIRKPKKR